MSRTMRMVAFMTLGMGLKSKRLDETPKRKNLLKRDWEQTGNIHILFNVTIYCRSNATLTKDQEPIVLF